MIDYPTQSDRGVAIPPELLGVGTPTPQPHFLRGDPPSTSRQGGGVYRQPPPDSGNLFRISPGLIIFLNAEWPHNFYIVNVNTFTYVPANE
jgi:hypothetical protein